MTFGYGPDDFPQAQWLADRLEGGWRYDHTAKQWHHWDGTRWAPDQTRQIELASAALAWEAAKTADTDGDRKSALKLTSLPALRRALEALATFEGYGTNGDDWDSVPYLLGVENGIVDLRSNMLVKNPDPAMLVTKSTGVKFSPVEGPEDFDKVAPTFMTVMRQWMSGDESMVAFLLLWFGASLFGFTPEQRFLMMVGIGRNGKGTLKHSIMQAVGEYGAQLDSNLYMRARNGSARSDQARADLLAIKGKRITFFSEPEGNKFNEELLKAHTGGDKIVARALYSNNVQTWDPTHSITFLVNDAPELDDLGPSMAARVMVADFRERFDGDKEDKTLYRVIEREAPGILSILCWSAAAWWASWDAGEGGISLPERVVEQSKAFMERNDPVANWLNDRATFSRDGRTPSQHAYESFVEWWKHEGESGDPMSQVKFALTLQKKGMTKGKTPQGMVWTGFRLLGAMELADREDVEDDEA